MQVWQSIIRHMRTIGPALWESQISSLLSHLHNNCDVSVDNNQSVCSESRRDTIDQYILATKMDCNRTWESEVEIMVLSNLLDTAVYTYDSTYGWNKYIPSNVHGQFDVTAHIDSHMSMYFRHNVNHYDVVTSVH